MNIKVFSYLCVFKFNSFRVKFGPAWSVSKLNKFCLNYILDIFILVNIICLQVTRIFKKITQYNEWKTFNMCGLPSFKYLCLLVTIRSNFYVFLHNICQSSAAARKLQLNRHILTLKFRWMSKPVTKQTSRLLGSVF